MQSAYGSGGEDANRVLVRSSVPPAPLSQTASQALEKSRGCLSCHVETDAKTMHESPAVQLGCVDCHGGDATQGLASISVLPGTPNYMAVLKKAHPLPHFKDVWDFPSSANPKQSFTLLNKENPEYVRFINPSDYRVAREACGACHLPIIEAAERSLMATSAMFWAAAAYNNGILPYKASDIWERRIRRMDSLQN